MGKRLAKHFHAIGIDLRNHGKSPHAPEMNYQVMADDIAGWMNAHDMDQAHLVGHSMGGKTAMLLACLQPNRVKTLTVADIAPKSYPPLFQDAFEGMLQTDPGRFRRKSEVEQALADYVNDPQLRRFLVTNLVPNESGTLKWQINLDAINRSLPLIGDNPLQQPMKFEGPVQFLCGSESDFVNPEDRSIILQHFPQSRIIEVPGAGHNVHIDNRTFFAEQIVGFIKEA
ncbi:MAG: hypothetical protein PWQ29_443 [Verrucomicrobiota bacterium]|nr:hypothetical protein [Verrucomicrobiota bacterium]MDK2963049.1 hypothetical protein [Verrucomicrobiota bacterium]